MFTMQELCDVVDAEVIKFQPIGGTKKEVPKLVHHDPEKPPYKFKHLRYFFDACVDDNNPLGIWHNGGATIVYQLYPNRLVYSLAICSRNDNFSRRVGRNIGIGRIKSGIYDEIPFTANSNLTKLFNETIKNNIYKRANHDGNWERDFADEIARNEVPSKLELALF